jgi:prohibitin 2
MSREAIQKFLNQAAKQGTPLLLLGGVVGAGGYAVSNATYKVDAGHLAVKYNRLSGIGSAIHREGLNFMLPWLERPIVFDIRARPTTTNSLTGSKDLQMVNITLRTLARPDQYRLPEIYRTLGSDYQELVLPSIVNEILKSVVAQYNASSLIMQRDLVSREIRHRLEQRAKDFHILLDDVAIVHINFSSEYEKAVESKQVAQQQAERARYRVVKAQEEKKRDIINAQGEQEQIRMIGKACQSDASFIDKRRIETAKEVAALLARSNNRMVLSTDSLLLDLMEQENKHLPEGSGVADKSAPPKKK